MCWLHGFYFHFKDLYVGYRRVLIQKYLTRKKEYVLTGSVMPNDISYSIFHHIRQWPIKSGSGSFSETCVENKIVEYAKSLLISIQRYGYRGPIDIELFQSEDGDVF